MRDLLEYALGKRPLDLLLEGPIVDVYTGEVLEGRIGFAKGRIAHLSFEGPRPKARRILRTRGYILPGLVDSHMHLESTMLTPRRFAEAVIPHGTAAALLDPHEIANVFGLRGVEWMLDASRELPIKLYFQVPSCVPASEFETSPGRIDLPALLALLSRDRVPGLGEVMDVPSVVLGDTGMHDKIDTVLAQGGIVDGHAPEVLGDWLNAYMASGPMSDHESHRFEEALEKLRKGMWVFLRYGTIERDIDRILPGILKAGLRARLLSFASDDLSPETIRDSGHVDRILRRAVELGMDPVDAVVSATLVPALYIRDPWLLPLRPGSYGSAVVVDDLSSFKVNTVILDGEVWFRGRLTKEIGPHRIPPDFLMSVRVPDLEPEDLLIRADGGSRARILVIGAQEDDVYTERLVEEAEVEDGVVLPPRGVHYAFVVERHGVYGGVGRGFVKGFGFSGGALAGTVAHDSHNMIVVSDDPEDALAAMRILREIGGGYALVADGEPVAAVRLEVAGLMSDRPIVEVAEDVDRLVSEYRSMGGTMGNPLHTLSFLSLSVIPALKLTDKGLVDVREFRIVDPVLEVMD